MDHTGLHPYEDNGENDREVNLLDLLTVDENSDINPASDSFNTEKYLTEAWKFAKKDFRHVTGVSFRNLNVSGSRTVMNTQTTVGGIFFTLIDYNKSYHINQRSHQTRILHNMEGLIRPGELLVVLGPPGSGCSTFLKTICGETHGIVLDPNSEFNYHGIDFKEMHSRFKGEVVYTAEQDVHFPELTVGVTLEFAALARAPRNIPANISRRSWARHIRDVMMAAFGISHTINTKVGNEYVRGVSGGERKRVSIAEAALGRSPFQCWDNSTRGLDSVNAIDFCKKLRLASKIIEKTEVVAIYQAPQMAYDQFDKVLLLYQGRQIFFGAANQARDYFLRLGFDCPERQTTPDFLTSMTSPTERCTQPGFENQVPRTADEFAQIWLSSPERSQLMKEIDEYNNSHPLGGPDFDTFQNAKRLQQAQWQSPNSPFMISYPQQVSLCLWRGIERVRANPELLITQICGQALAMLAISTLYFQLKADAGHFHSRESLIFFATLTNAFSSQLEIISLYAQRPIVEKHARYALYRPSAEAIASMLTDLPSKLLNAILFNIILYFVTGLKLTAGAFFFFFLTSLLLILTMSSLFRVLASVSRTLSQAIAPGAVVMVALCIYSGLPLPPPNMKGWARWISWINPIAYGFESLMINEFHGREFDCTTYIPSGPGYNTDSAHRICSAVGSVAGQAWVSGDAYLEAYFHYEHSHKWRNVGVLAGFWALLTMCYLAATDSISSQKSKGEVLFFLRKKVSRKLRYMGGDIENGLGNISSEIDTSRRSMENIPRAPDLGIHQQTAIFQWEDLSYKIKTKDMDRLILDGIDGWVCPGTLTALMGVSGAGKTTLLDVLASRVTVGVIQGTVLVNGIPRDDSFQRKTGYAQQQDLHLKTSTVREALGFSALLRQPDHYSRSEKLAYVDHVIQLLEMEEIEDAIVGDPGEGLNIEQRKKLTIGVELAARPELLLFLDEPTSGLDSQTSWSILKLLRKLRDNGQAVLCTIHQPSTILFQQFDRLLLLAKRGKTVYFGPIGDSASIVLDYFERNGGYKCPSDANPAEYMLEVIGATAGCHTDIDWPYVWAQSAEQAAVRAQLDEWKENLPNQQASLTVQGKRSYSEFAVSLPVQLHQTLIRIFQQYWRTPSYIYAKLGLVGGVGLLVAFSFYDGSYSRRGLDGQIFSLFMFMIIFGELAQQVMPQFVTQRALYEARERPSKVYSWFAFIVSNILVEIPWAFLCAVILSVCWYIPIRLYEDTEPWRGIGGRCLQISLIITEFTFFSSTFAHLAIAAITSAETAGNIVNLCFVMSLLFCGVLAGPKVFPHFWIWMYRVSPFNYILSGLFTASVSDSTIVCSDTEHVYFDPEPNLTCGEYLANFIQNSGGDVKNPSARSHCKFCPWSYTNAFLQFISIEPHQPWRDVGLLSIYIAFNICGTIFLYWFFRVRSKVTK